MTDSPFLPDSDLQFAWDSTSLGWLKTCPRLYYYHMIEGWAGQGEAIHLKFGIEYHQALHDYENQRAAGAEHDDALVATIWNLVQHNKDWSPIPQTESETKKNPETLIRTVIWYLEHYREDPAKTYILKDGTPAMELSFRFELDWGPNFDQQYLLCGHLDRVVDFQDQIYIMDRKTTSTTPGSYYFNQFEPNNQMTLYTIASQVIFDSPIKGIIIDCAQVGVGFSRFVRGITYRNRDKMAEWLKDLGYWTTMAEQFSINHYWPMNDTACDKFGGCKFREVCSHSPGVRDKILKSTFIQENRWNPLKAR